MKTIELTKGFVTRVDDDDYERMSQFSWYANEKPNGRVYARRTFIKPDGKKGHQSLHRFLMEVTDPTILIDHGDHDGLNNQKYNLRVCTNQQNVFNKRKTRGNSKYKGVYWKISKNSWCSTIRINGTTIHLGYFKVEIEAALAYDVAAREHVGEFACCNFPPKKPSVAAQSRTRKKAAEEQS